MKDAIFKSVEAQRQALTSMADDIFDHPELGFQEFHAEKVITDYLAEAGFAVEHGVGGVETAFRAEFNNGQGGPKIGLLCEYDALEGIGHACGHHMQGPAIIGAAKALKDCAGDTPYSVIVYGTPAEETAHGKLRMLENGCFKDIDVALMMHGSPTTTVDVKSLAMSSFTVTFHGKKAHAALKPEDGRSALDALLVAFQGVEFLREHVPEDTRMHYTLEGDQKSIQSTAAVLGLQSRMGLLAMEGDSKAGHGQGLYINSGGGRTVHHQGDVNILEAAVFQHTEFAVGGLLSGSAVDTDGVGSVSGTVFQGLCRTDDGRTLHMVPAGVADPFKGVVLAEQTNLGTALSVVELGPECGLDTADTVLNCETGFCQVVGDDLFSVELLKSQFGMVEDIIGHRGQRLTLGLNRFENCFFHKNTPLCFQSTG